MKKLLSVLVVLIILNSCKKKSNFDMNVYPQKWELVSIIGNIANTKSLSGDNLPYKETYTLNKDSSFIKIRINNELTQKASGTFTIEKFDNYSHFVFKYSIKNDLIGSCVIIELKEHLTIKSNSNIYNNAWQACDGPVLEYERVE